MSFHVLRENFQELYHAEHAPQSQELPLVANYFGTRIYDARYGWGILWKWFYNIAALFSEKELHRSKLKEALLHTHAQFLKQLPIIQESLEQYQRYLKKASNGYEVDEQTILQARRCVTNWHESTEPFFKLIEKKPRRLLQLFEQCWPAQTELFVQSFGSSLLDCHHVICAEGISKGPLPLAIFKKMVKQKPLNSYENKELLKWIGTINETTQYCQEIHQGLKVLTQLFQRKNSNGTAKELDLIDFELLLESKGCKVFRQSSPQHMKWSKKLKKGVKLPYQGTKIVLGNELVTPISHVNQKRVFQINGMPKRVLVVAQNCLVLSLMQRQHGHEKQEFIKAVPISTISPSGRFALMERLQSIVDYTWPQNENDLFENPVFNSLKLLLQDMVAKNYTPEGFSAHALMLDGEGHLNSLRKSKKLPFDFNAVEDFIMQCGSGQNHVYEQLLLVSGLHAHSVARFYYDVMEYAVRGEKIEIDDLAAIYKISDHKVVDRAIHFSQEVKRLHSKLFLHLQKRFPDEDAQELNTKIGKAILQLHRRMKSIGVLNPGLFQSVESQTQFQVKAQA